MEAAREISAKWEDLYKRADARAQKWQEENEKLADRIKELEERVAYWKALARRERSRSPR